MTRFFCSKHGDQGPVVGIEINITASPGFVLPDALIPRAQRRYCMCCWVDMMDEHLLPLGEIND